MKRVLLLTAGFGEGHNSAARAVGEALDACGEAEARTTDLYAVAIPAVNRSVKLGYSIAINRLPWAWRLIFTFLDRPDWMEATLWAAGGLRKALDAEITDFRPDVIVSTYPLYAYLFRRIQQVRLGTGMPFITVITDSVGVNSAWYRCRSDAFVVADQETADLLTADGVPHDIVHPLGFPVARYFRTAPTLPATSSAPWKILFMPSTQQLLTLKQIRALLTVPDVEVTVLAGRHARIFDAVNESGLASGPRCKLIGWTDAVPELLCSHHLFVGKAGGAIVQEAIAASCPFLVSHLVPGQEEGNIALIERLGIGARVLGKPETLAGAVGQAFAGDAKLWREWKVNLARARRTDAADRVAQFALERAGR